MENEIIFPEAISALKENGGWIEIEKAQDFALAKKHGWIAALDDLDARKIAKKEHGYHRWYSGYEKETER